MHSSRQSNGESKNQIEPKRIVYHPQALDELIDAAEYYDLCSPGLGGRFVDGVESAADFICKNPYLLAPDKSGCRKYVMKKFPFLIIYRVKDDCIYILAVAHGKRKPGYWKKRD
jgi:toxin ParE1/3/4